MLRVSKMTGKLAGISAINTSPLDNPFCLAMSKGGKDLICSRCYSCAMLNGLRKKCRPSWKSNGDILSRAGLAESEIPRIKTAYCRFSAHGELINRTHAENFFAIARANPDITFGFWTKRPELVDVASKPANVFLIYSSPIINKSLPLPVGFDRVFTVYTREYAKKHNVAINCAGRKCSECLLCYLDNGEKEINEILR